MADMHFIFVLTFFKKEFVQSKASLHTVWQSNDTKMIAVKFNTKHWLQLNTKYSFLMRYIITDGLQTYKTSKEGKASMQKKDGKLY